MALEITGKIIQILAEQSGTGKNGQWSKQDFILETEEQYPRKVCFSAWGDKVVQVKSLKQNSSVRVSFNVESREYNGRWYTDLRIWKIEMNENKVAPMEETPMNSFDLEPLSAQESAVEGDDLPF